MRTAIVFLLLCLTLVSAHVCMINPVQRGGFNIGQPGDMSCFQPSGPCGKVTPSIPKVQFIGGSSVSILFQQNLNHYNVGNPGKLELSWAQGSNPQESDFQVLATLPDYWAHNQAQQTNFSVPVLIPNINCAWCTLRVIYHPFKPTEPIFHNCADISIVSSATVPRPGQDGKGVLYGLTSSNSYDASPQTLSSVNIQNGVITPIQELGYLYKTQGADAQIFLEDGMLAVSSSNVIYFYGGTINGNARNAGSLYQYDGISFTTKASNMQPENGTWCSLISHYEEEKRGLGILKQIGNSDYEFSYEIYNLTPDGQLRGPLASTIPNDTFVNFFWAEFSTKFQEYYVFAGDENNPFLLDAVLHTLNPISGQVTNVSLDVSRFTFSTFSIDQQSGILYAVSPGLFAENKGFTLVKIDPRTGSVTPVKNVNQGSKYAHNYAGNVYNPIFQGYFMHVLTDTSTGGQVLAAFSLQDGSIAYTTALELGVNRKMALNNLVMTSRQQ